MPVSAGARLGPYAILDLVGAGGMGEVYRARDPRLGRDVAIKVLPEDLAADSDRLRRFEQEARAVASLSHPNVVVVHDVGNEGGRPYLVTELLEGTTLAERLRKGALSLREAIETAVQVAHGLAAAHAKQIVHRDLKSANVFLTRDGRVKILDFGLARWERLAPEETTASVATGPGTVLGTVGYMSPEQVRGGRGDHRSDVFSFGVLLYEMVSGRHPFRRKTGVETQTAILREEPLALNGLGLPEALERVVLRCLEKRPEDRFHSAHDLALALQSIAGAPLTPLPPPGMGIPEPGPYPGLRPFTEEQRESFFGRQAEVAALWEKLQRRKLLSLIGPSGVGKTSFVRAGLVPARPSGWRCVTTTPGRRPFASLARALVPELSSDTEALQELVGFDDPEVAVRLVGRWRRRLVGALVIVDQLEELFTLNPPDVQAAFAQLLRRLCDEADVHVLLSLRDDFFFACHAHPALAEVFTEVTPLGSLAGDGLRLALVEPAKRNGFRFEDEALVDEMCGAVEGERGALPLLAFCAAKLWERRDREGKLLTRDACEEIGGVAGALAQHAEATLEAIGTERQGIVREIFRNLVTAQGTRAACEREELLSVFPDRKAAQDVLSALVDARLLTSFEAADGSNQHRVEIVHESLLKAWPRLVRWQTQDEDGAQLRDQLKQAAHLWDEKSRSADLLWSGAPFREYELWRERYPGTLTALEEDFARAMAERAQRRRRLRRLVAGAVVATALLVAAVTGALWRRSEVARGRATAEALRAEAGQLLALGRMQLEADSTAALAHARGSLALHDTPEARRFALEVLWRGPVARVLDVGRAVKQLQLPPEASHLTRLAVSPDGRWLAGGTQNGQLLLFDGEGGPPRAPPVPRDSRGWVLGFGPRSDLLIAPGPGHALQYWSLPDLRETRTVPLTGLSSWGFVQGERVIAYTQLSGNGQSVAQVLELPDGEPKAVAELAAGVFLGETADPTGARVPIVRDRTVGLVALDGTNHVRVLGGIRDDPYDVTHSPRGDLVAATDQSAETTIWSTAGGVARVVRILEGPKFTRNSSTLFDPYGRRISQAGPAGSNYLWDLEEFPDAQPLVLGRTGESDLHALGYDPTGRWLVAGDLARATIEFWPVGSPRRRVLPGFASSPSLAFTRDGRWLATCPTMRPARLWPRGVKDGNARDLVEDCSSIATHPTDGQVLVGGSGAVLLYPPRGGAPRVLLDPHSRSPDVQGFAVAFDPQGRRAVARSAAFYGIADRESRVLVVWDLPSGQKRAYPAADFSDGKWEGWAPTFAPDGRLFASGPGGVRRLTLPLDTAGTVASETVYSAGIAGHDLSRDGRHLLVSATRSSGRGDPHEDLLLFDLAANTSRRITTHGVRLSVCRLSPSGRIVVTGDHDGVVRAGPVSGGEPQLLLGHKGPVHGLAISADERWIASSSDESISIWPMPDVTKPPLHTLAQAELLAKLDALTNLRVVRDASSATGWNLDVGPFPGWKDVSTW